MTVALTPERAIQLKTACINLAAETSPSIQEVAHVVGLMVASFPAVKFSALLYRALERGKTQALKVRKGNYTVSMTLSQDALDDLRGGYPMLRHHSNLSRKTRYCYSV